MTRTIPALLVSFALAMPAPAASGPLVVAPPPVRMVAASGAPAVPVAVAPLPAAATPLQPWAGTFSAEAAATGVPLGLLLAVALVESGGDPTARSSAGAVGLLQVLPVAHPHLCPCGAAANNIRAGAIILARYAALAGASPACLASGPGGTSGCARATDRALSAYNQGPNAPGVRWGYVQRVRADWVRIAREEAAA